MQGREHQVAGQSGLHRHLGGLQVADFAHHDDVRVLAHQRAQAFGEIEVELRLHLGLVERRLYHLDRVFDRADVDLFGGNPLERGIQRGGLARAGRPGHQDNAVRAFNQRLPALRVMGREAQRIKVLDRVVGVEDTHHHFFAEGRGQGRDAHLDLIPARVAGLDAPILRPALFHDVHAPEQLDARRHRAQHAHRHLVHRMQHAVDAEADHALLAPRLQVDVTGTLVERVLPQPVHHLHHALVVGVELFVGLAELDQLLEAGAGRCTTRLHGRADRLGEREKLGRKAMDVLRAGDHPPYASARLPLHLGHPIGNKRLGRGDHHLGRGYLNRQYAVAFRVAGTHDVGHLANVHA